MRGREGECCWIGRWYIEGCRVRVSRVESAGGAISGVCFAPGSRDQLRTSLW